MQLNVGSFSAQAVDCFGLFSPIDDETEMEKTKEMTFLNNENTPYSMS